MRRRSAPWSRAVLRRYHVDRATPASRHARVVETETGAQVPNEWIPLTGAALKLRKSYNQTLHLLLLGELPGKKIRSRRLVSAAAVAAFSKNTEDEVKSP